MRFIQKCFFLSIKILTKSQMSLRSYRAEPAVKDDDFPSD